MMVAVRVPDRSQAFVVFLDRRRIAGEGPMDRFRCAQAREQPVEQTLRRERIQSEGRIPRGDPAWS